MVSDTCDDKFLTMMKNSIGHSQKLTALPDVLNYPSYLLEIFCKGYWKVYMQSHVRVTTVINVLHHNYNSPSTVCPVFSSLFTISYISRELCRYYSW